MDWVYKQIIGFLANFFAEMGNMGAEMFEMSWVQSIVLFFSYLAWILYAVGFVVACACSAARGERWPASCAAFRSCGARRWAAAR